MVILQNAKRNLQLLQRPPPYVSRVSCPGNGSSKSAGRAEGDFFCLKAKGS